MKKFFVVILVFCSSMFTSQETKGQIINIPGDYPTIQLGINAAANGDTVLVQPGRYLERINFKSKHITVGSLYLITGDTSYISQTIIDADSSQGPVVNISGGQDSSSVLCGFTITGASGGYKGGGVLVMDASPCLKNLVISGNTNWNGGGIAIDNSGAIIQDVLICNNSAYNDYIGGSCNPDAAGGGMHCIDANPVLINVTISDNTVKSLRGSTTGGGIYCFRSNMILHDVTIERNVVDYRLQDWFGGGGGISCFDSTLYFSNVRITENRAKFGGGISGRFNGSSLIVFDSNNRSDIYMNRATLGNDLYNLSGVFELDTFTVLSPTEFHAYPVGNYLFDILNGKLEQEEADLFVSPNGNNFSSGLSAAEPLQNVWCAFSKMLADSLHPHAIHLQEGTYSSLSNDEMLPFRILDHISIAGESEDKVTLDAEGRSGVLILDSVTGVNISGLTIKGGSADHGAGINCNGSEANFQDITIRNNDSYAWANHLGGGGMFCNSSNLELKDMSIIKNSSFYGGGGIFIQGSGIAIENVIVDSNYSDQGGGIFIGEGAVPVLKNVTIKNNNSNEGGGLFCNKSIPVFDSIERCNIYLNSAVWGNDVYTDTNVLIKVDTFTVLYPNEFHAGPLDKFTFDILHGKLDQIDADVYISPLGSNTNSGLTPDQPLKTIHYATSLMIADSIHQNTLQLLNGTYSKSASGESFPINIPDYVNVHGESESSVILDAGGHSGVMIIDKNHQNNLSGMTISGGYSDEGGGISIKYSSPTLSEIIVTNNHGIEFNSYGGGIYLYYSDPDLQDLIISSNSADNGAGIYCENSNPVMKDITIINNSTISAYAPGGGGIYFKNSSPSLIDIVVSDNSAGDGGGIFCENSHPVIQNSEISGNRAYHYKGTGGGGICLINSNPVLQGVEILNNTAREFGMTGGGGIYCNNSNPVLSNLTISGNLATNGGGLFLDNNSNPDMQNVIIASNTSDKLSTVYTGGGGICCKASSPILNNVQIISNYSDGNGGGIACIGNSSPEFNNVVISGDSAQSGGGIFTDSLCNPVLRNVSLSGNFADENGGAIYAHSSSSPLIVNSILWGNLPQEVYGNTIDITYSDILGGWDGEGNIELDPLFVGSGDHPYSLSSSSPCINAGNPDTAGHFLPAHDLIGNPRIWNDRIDMGAYEWNNLGFDDQAGENENLWLRINPNPAEDVVVVSVYSSQFAVGSRVSVTIYDLFGRQFKTLMDEMKSPREFTMWINISNLPAGFYLVMLQAGEQVVSKKLIVQ